MNTASRELCERLYELSEWEDCVWFHFKGRLWTFGELRGQTVSEVNRPIAAYDLGYLLRKLPVSYRFHNFEIVPRRDGSWYIGYSQGLNVVNVGEEPDWLIFTEAATPEDATCKLAIKLFEQGILKQDKDSI